MVWLSFTFLHFSMSFFCTQDDVVSQRHKFGSAFLSYFPRSKNLPFLTFPYSVPVPKNCVFFIGCNFESRASQVGVHQQKKDCASAKAGKVSLLRREGQSQGCALTYGARSPKATNWPRAMKKLSRSAQPGGMLVLVS